jgi:hypothetical protein
MTRARPPRGRGNDSSQGPPREINMTDLGWTEEDANANPSDPHAAGTPGGGTASGGLAGSNSGNGDPDETSLEAALGSGVHDTDGEEAEEPGYAGPSGGAVGGTPAGGRVRGGHTGGGLRPEAGRREGTLGVDSLDNKEGRP